MTTVVIRESNGYRLVKDLFSHMYVVDTDQEIGLWMDVYDAQPFLEDISNEEFEVLCKEYI